MEFILSPAVHFMNRINYASKFGLISLLFFLALCFSSYFPLSQSLREIEATEKERLGLIQLHQVQQFLRKLEHANDIALANALNSVTVPPDTITEQHVLDRFFDAQAQLDVLNERSQGEDVRYQEYLISINSKLKKAATAHQQARGAMARELIVDVRNFQSYISFSSGLSQDPVVRVNVLLALLKDDIAESRKLLGGIRSLGSHVLAFKQLSGSASNNAEQFFDQGRSNYNQLQSKVQEVIESDSELHKQLLSTTNDALEALQLANNRLDSDILISMNLDTPWSDYYLALSEQITVVDLWEDQVINVIDALLSVRLEQKQDEMIGLATALVIIFLLIIYLYLAFYTSIKNSIRQLLDSAVHMAEGDMTVSINTLSHDEIGELSTAFNNMSAKIRALIQEVSSTASEVAVQSQTGMSIAEQSRISAGDQLRDVDTVVSAIQEMVSSASDAANNSANAAESAVHANAEGKSGRQLVASAQHAIEQLAERINESVETINQLEQESGKISQVLDVIKSIADQTNLLALNAAIEAARAGEQGRGFAVVADEVRNLAQQTQNSASEIEKMIINLQGGVGQVVTSMRTSHEMTDNTVEASQKVEGALANVAVAVSKISDEMVLLAQASEQQKQAADEIQASVTSISTAGEKTFEGAESSARSSKLMTELIEKLQQLIASFQV